MRYWHLGDPAACGGQLVDRSEIELERSLSPVREERCSGCQALYREERHLACKAELIALEIDEQASKVTAGLHELVAFEMVDE